MSIFGLCDSTDIIPCFTILYFTNANHQALPIGTSVYSALLSHKGFSYSMYLLITIQSYYSIHTLSVLNVCAGCYKNPNRLYWPSLYKHVKKILSGLKSKCFKWLSAYFAHFMCMCTPTHAHPRTHIHTHT